MNFERGDHVFHPGTRETWVVRRVRDGWVEICGWPPTTVRAKDVKLVDRPPEAETQRLFGEGK